LRLVGALVLVTNNGMQGFINVEQRSGDDFLETLDTTVGLLYQF
jgi:hypothetical protein